MNDTNYDDNDDDDKLKCASYVYVCKYSWKLLKLISKGKNHYVTSTETKQTLRVC